MRYTENIVSTQVSRAKLSTIARAVQASIKKVSSFTGRSLVIRTILTKLGYTATLKSATGITGHTERSLSIGFDTMPLTMNKKKSTERVTMTDTEQRDEDLYRYGPSRH